MQKLAASNEIIREYSQLFDSGVISWPEAVNSMVVELEAQNAGLAALVMREAPRREPESTT